VRSADHLLVGAALGLAVASKYTAAPRRRLTAVSRSCSRVGPSFFIRNLVAGAHCPRLLLRRHTVQLPPLLAAARAMAHEYEHVHSLHYGFSLPAAGWSVPQYVYELFAGFPFSLGFALSGRRAGRR